MVARRQSALLWPLSLAARAVRAARTREGRDVTAAKKQRQQQQQQNQPNSRGAAARHLLQSARRRSVLRAAASRLRAPSVPPSSPPCSDNLLASSKTLGHTHARPRPSERQPRLARPHQAHAPRATMVRPRLDACPRDSPTTTNASCQWPGARLVSVGKTEGGRHACKR